MQCGGKAFLRLLGDESYVWHLFWVRLECLEGTAGIKGGVTFFRLVKHAVRRHHGIGGDHKCVEAERWLG